LLPTNNPNRTHTTRARLFEPKQRLAHRIDAVIVGCIRKGHEFVDQSVNPRATRIHGQKHVTSLDLRAYRIQSGYLITLRFDKYNS
jgi:hypothetical protein